MSPLQRRVFLVVFTLAVSFVILVSMEGGLRLLGFGGYPSTFRKAGTLEGGSTLVFTDHGGPTSYFFANRSLPGSLDPTAFVSPKPKNVFRVIVIGESAAKGNPYPRALSWSTMFQAMLAGLKPDRQVEVINLGTTAIASFPALGLLTEALEYEADLVVVYVGNNEFYGAYGVASMHSAGRSPGMLGLVRLIRSLAISQFIDENVLPAARGDPSTTLMEAMMGRSQIGAHDPARAAAARNLGTFVSDMAARCKARGIAVIVCTPPANERDLAPLGTPDVAGISAAAIEELERQLRLASELMTADSEAAASAARRAIALAPEHAGAHYQYGRALFEQGKFDQSAAEFRAALDLDTMPWRPPSASVAAVRAAAERGGAPVCDLERVFRAASPGGSIGWELMADHVHPSLRGQYAIARALIATLEGIPGPVGVAPGATDAIPDFAALTSALGDNPYERFAASSAMRRLAETPLFRATNPGFFDLHDGTCREVESGADPAVLEQIRRWQDPATHRAEIRSISGMIGYALLNTGRAVEAEQAFTAAAGSVTPYGSRELEYRYMTLVCRQMSAGRVTDADRAEALRAICRGRAILSLGPSKTGATELYVGLLLQLCGDFPASIPLLEVAHDRLQGPNRLAPAEALAAAYVRAGRVDHAAALLDAGIGAGGVSAGEYRKIRQRILPRREGGG